MLQYLRRCFPKVELSPKIEIDVVLVSTENHRLSIITMARKRKCEG